MFRVVVSAQQRAMQCKLKMARRHKAARLLMRSHAQHAGIETMLQITRRHKDKRNKPAHQATAHCMVAAAGHA